MSDLTAKAISFTNLIGRLALAGEKALPVIDAVAQWVPIPYVGAIVHALDIAAPYISKIAQGAPIVAKLIEAGTPAIEALQKASPDLLHNFKELYAVAVNHDPERPEENMTASDVTNEQVASFTGSIFERSFFTPQDPRFERDKNFG